MINLVISIGIILIPFCEILVRGIPYTMPIPADTRMMKAALALFFALTIGLIGLYKNRDNSVRNKWLLILVGYCLLSSAYWFQMPLVINDIDMNNFYIWKPLFQIMCFFLMFIGVSNMSIWKVNKILEVLVWSSLVMSLYTLLQYFKIEQFFEPKPFTEIGWAITNPYMVGNLGQPTIVAPFIALSVPIAIYLRRYFVAIILTATTLLINSRITTSALIISLLIYLCMAKKEMILPVIIISLFVCIYIPQKFNLYQESNGRFQNWQMVIEDWKGSPVKEGKERYSYFGVGLGSFGYIFHDKHKTIFHQAHNDALEVLYSLGIVGLFLYLMAIFEGLKNGFIAYLHGHYFEKPLFIALICGFILMFLNSLGTFLFQLGVYQYIAVLFFGLINNKNLIGRA